MIVIGIDPGNTESAFCTVDEHYKIIDAGKVDNEILIGAVSKFIADQIALESIQSYGMAVGKEVFETCYMIGRIQQRAKDKKIPYTLYPRPEYARAICGVGKISDAILWQALKLRFGGDRKGEPLNLLRGNSDKRSAFAVAAYHLDLKKVRNL